MVSSHNVTARLLGSTDRRTAAPNSIERPKRQERDTHRASGTLAHWRVGLLSQRQGEAQRLLLTLAGTHLSTILVAQRIRNRFAKRGHHSRIILLPSACLNARQCGLRRLPVHAHPEVIVRCNSHGLAEDSDVRRRATRSVVIMVSLDYWRHILQEVDASHEFPLQLRHACRRRLRGQRPQHQCHAAEPPVKVA